jgi:hypothetical protein
MDTASICFPDSGPLPIGFNFYVTKLQGSAKLLWETNSIDVLKFEVERSSDGVQFSSIASVDFVTGETNYSYNDTYYFKHGITYYRIKELRANSGFNYSRVQKISNSENVITHIYPIPAKDFVKVNLNLSGNTTHIEIGLFDAVGRMVWSKSIGANTSETNIPVNKLSGGLYLLKLTINGSQNEIHKIIVQ